MTGWGQSRALRNAREATRALATRRAETEDFENFFLAARSSIARSISPDEELPPTRRQPIPTRDAHPPGHQE
jgi:hypothetical protein